MGECFLKQRGGSGSYSGSLPKFAYSGRWELVDDGKTNNIQNWRIKLLTSGTFVPFHNITVDVFAVGGGGGGSAGGGGGGYTTTVKNIVLTKGTSYTITVGAGGSAGTNSDAGDGGYTRMVSGSTQLINANGGEGSINIQSTGNSGPGVTWAGAGQSGGGGYGAYAGGSNGGNGAGSTAYPGAAGNGQTTREFGETSGTLYSAGGEGGFYADWDVMGGNSTDGIGGVASTSHSTRGTAGKTNTGSGGGGSSYGSKVPGGGAGGSGILILRNKR